jgi:hypothetical protein
MFDTSTQAQEWLFSPSLLKEIKEKRMEDIPTTERDSILRKRISQMLSKDFSRLPDSVIVRRYQNSFESFSNI